jgi:hypothetical protein
VEGKHSFHPTVANATTTLNERVEQETLSGRNTLGLPGDKNLYPPATPLPLDLETFIDVTSSTGNRCITVNLGSSATE